MNILILVFLFLAGCKTTSSSSLKTESEATRVSTEAARTATKETTKTTVKKKIEQDASKITDTAETFEILAVPNGPPISVLKSRKIVVKEIGKKIAEVDTLKDEQIKKFEELKKRAEEAEKKRLEDERKKTMSPALSCVASGWLFGLAVGSGIILLLRNFGSKLPFPLNIFSKKE